MVSNWTIFILLGITCMNRKNNKTTKIIAFCILASFLSLQILPSALANKMKICRFAQSKNHLNVSFVNPDINNKKLIFTNKNEESCCKSLSSLSEQNKNLMDKVSNSDLCSPEKCDDYSYSCCNQITFFFLQSSNKYLCFSLLSIFIPFCISFLFFNYGSKYFRPPQIFFNL